MPPFKDGTDKILFSSFSSEIILTKLSISLKSRYTEANLIYATLSISFSLRSTSSPISSDDTSRLNWFFNSCTIFFNHFFKVFDLYRTFHRSSRKSVYQLVTIKRFNGIILFHNHKRYCFHHFIGRKTALARQTFTLCEFIFRRADCLLPCCPHIRIPGISSVFLAFALILTVSFSIFLYLCILTHFRSFFKHFL